MTNCTICHKNENAPLYPDVSIVKCQCGHIYFNENLTEEQLKEIYSNDYFSGAEYVDYLSDKKITQYNFKSRLKDVTNYCSSGELLEVGSAHGFFLDLAQENFKVKGYEINESAAEYATKELKLDVSSEDFLTADLPDNNYDVVCMWDCIEHLTEPHLFIQKINSTLKPGGHIFLTTGDIGAALPKMQGRNWRMIHPPSHIHYFHKKSITDLLTKNGYEDVKITYPGYWRSFALLFSKILPKPFQKTAEKMPGYFWSNTFDIFQVVAKKSQPSN